MEILNYKCPSCGGPLHFSSKDQLLKCDACGNTYDADELEQLSDLETDESGAEEEIFEGEDELNFEEYNGKTLDDVVEYVCPSCGGTIVGDKNTIATSCPYCDNPTVISQNVSGVMRPDVLIPFKLDKNDAKAGLLKFYKGKSLMPRMFKDENVIDKIRGIYVPFWLFCCDADGAASYHATRVRTWSDAKYTYTQTNHYSVYREGGAHFEQIPVDASSKMDDNLMDSIEPYDYTEAIPFGSSYLSGYVSDKYDVDQQASIPRAGERVKNTMDDYLRKSVLGYATVTKTGSRIATSNGRAIYALLPVWILNTKWKDKTYTFAMNGQTGKFVGDLPCDTGKFWLKMLTITLSIAAPLFILALLFL